MQRSCRGISSWQGQKNQINLSALSTHPLTELPLPEPPPGSHLADFLEVKLGQGVQPIRQLAQVEKLHLVPEMQGGAT